MDITYNKKLLDCCRNKSFNIAEAEEILECLSSIDEIFKAKMPNYDIEYKTSYLWEAATYGNSKMVELLIKHGIEPNVVISEESLLWDLRFNDDEHPENNIGRLESAELLLKNGVSPLIEADGDTLFDEVCFAVFNDATGEYYEYLRRFFTLLIIYGGTTNYCSPRILIPFDFNNTEKYEFYIQQHENSDGLYGIIVDEHDNLVAIV